MKTIRPFYPTNTKKLLERCIHIPADKSISHRALLFSAIAQGTATICNLLQSEDVLHTMQILRQCGVHIDAHTTKDGVVYTVHGTDDFVEPTHELYCGNSGTTMRLLLGLFASFPMKVTVTGDASLQKRPMKRITHILEQLGIQCEGSDSANLAPITISGTRNVPFFEHHMSVESAQVKTALALLALRCNGGIIRGGGSSRDHTEKMFRSMGIQCVDLGDGDIQVFPGRLQAKDITVPNDFSSAAFFIALGVLLPNSRFVLPNILVNPTRTGFLETLLEMGAQINIENLRHIQGEEVGDIVVCSSSLVGVHIPITRIPTMIDELPILAIVASQARGQTLVQGALDARNKESDRIKTTVEMITNLGMDITEIEDGWRMEGPQCIQGGQVSSFADHRIAMSAAIAGLVAQNPVTIDSVACVQTSFPQFFEIVDDLAV